MSETGIVVDRAEFSRRVREARAAGREVVFTNGCFDILHVGHLRYLEAARAEGDMLVVAVNDDAGVRRLKGEGRPVVPGAERMELLAGLRCVDLVTDFGEDTPHALLEEARPSVLVKGGDYSYEEVQGHEVVTGYGGRVAVLQFVPGRSTTDLVRAAARTAALEAGDG